MRKKIGFIQPDYDDIPADNKSDDDLLVVFIKNIYSPNGEVDKKEFLTSSELMYELKGMVDASVTQVSRAMSEIGFDTITIEGTICWVVFRSCEDMDE